MHVLLGAFQIKCSEASFYNTGLSNYIIITAISPAEYYLFWIKLYNMNILFLLDKVVNGKKKSFAFSFIYC